jgi:hypothetical protein
MLLSTAVPVTWVIAFQIDGGVTSTSDCGTRNAILSWTLPVTTGKGGEGEMREGATINVLPHRV